MSRRCAVIVIGQTPRPDLVEPVRARLPPGSSLLELGALDGMDPEDISRLEARGAGDAPLATRLADGRRVVLDESILAPLVEGATGRAREAGATVGLLLCAGGFERITPAIPLLRPPAAAAALLRTLGLARLAVVVPMASQAEPSRRRWQDAGFDASPVVASGEEVPVVPADSGDIDAVVLDYVGHPAGYVAAVRAAIDRPVLDLGEVGALALAAVA
jgi:protein AroM